MWLVSVYRSGSSSARSGQSGSEVTTTSAAQNNTKYLQVLKSECPAWAVVLSNRETSRAVQTLKTFAIPFWQYTFFSFLFFGGDIFCLLVSVLVPAMVDLCLLWILFPKGSLLHQSCYTSYWINLNISICTEFYQGILTIVCIYMPVTCWISCFHFTWRT